jgi:hypothetical protein
MPRLPQELSEDQLADEDMFWWRNKFDLVCKGINVDMIKAFLAFKKRKENGKCSSHVQLRKHNDAILWGAKTSRQRLPLSCCEEMEKLLVAFKKEMTVAKKDGTLDEQEADPISWGLFRKTLQWAVERKTFVCGCFLFCNGTAWLVRSTSASWLCVASVLAKTTSEPRPRLVESFLDSWD